jgi:hypothetical protein
MVPQPLPIGRWRSDRGTLIGTVKEVASYLDKPVGEIEEVVNRGIEPRVTERRRNNTVAIHTSRIREIVAIQDGFELTNGFDHNTSE